MTTDEMLTWAEKELDKRELVKLAELAKEHRWDGNIPLSFFFRQYIKNMWRQVPIREDMGR